MAIHVTQAMLDRPKRTMRAAEVVLQQAGSIANACTEAGPNEVVVAVVEAREMSFAGTWIVPVGDVPARVPEIEQDGWALIFAPTTTEQQVEDRALDMARLAYQRWERLVRLIRRRG